MSASYGSDKLIKSAVPAGDEAIPTDEFSGESGGNTWQFATLFVKNSGTVTITPFFYNKLLAKYIPGSSDTVSGDGISFVSIDGHNDVFYRLTAITTDGSGVNVAARYVNR